MTLTKETDTVTNFESLGLSETILKAVAQKGYKSPSPIQAKAIPAVLTGNDVMAAAQTGTGKTAGFTLPILEKLQHKPHTKSKNTQVLILTPTRELAAQIQQSVMDYSAHSPVSSTVVFGGVNINAQKAKLRAGVDILVATPGRLLDLSNQRAVEFSQVDLFVLDEADRMLDMGFIPDIKKIMALLPKKRQTLLFSATFSNQIRRLAKSMLNNPIEISVTPKNTAAPTVTQWIVPVDKGKKAAILIELIRDNNWDQVLVFCRTKHGSNRLTQQLMKKGIKAAAIHGNKSQGARTKALADFKGGRVKILVATDIAARGLDIDQLPQVVNFELPHVPEDYVHRIGRTGRAGAEGNALSLVCAEEFKQLSDIERLIKTILTRKPMDGFTLAQSLPESSLERRHFSPSNPRKKYNQHQTKSRPWSQSGQRRSTQSRSYSSR